MLEKLLKQKTTTINLLSTRATSGRPPTDSGQSKGTTSVDSDDLRWLGTSGANPGLTWLKNKTKC